MKLLIAGFATRPPPDIGLPLDIDMRTFGVPRQVAQILNLS